MKKQINPTIKAHLIRGAFYLLLLVAVCAIPFALAQRISQRADCQAKPSRPVSAPNPDAGLCLAAPAGQACRNVQRQASKQIQQPLDSVLNHLGDQPSKQAHSSWFFPNYLTDDGTDCNDSVGHRDSRRWHLKNGCSWNPRCWRHRSDDTSTNLPRLQLPEHLLICCAWISSHWLEVSHDVSRGHCGR